MICTTASDVSDAAGQEHPELLSSLGFFLGPLHTFSSRNTSVAVQDSDFFHTNCKLCELTHELASRCGNCVLPGVPR